MEAYYLKHIFQMYTSKYIQSIYTLKSPVSVQGKSFSLKDGSKLQSESLL